MTWTAGLRTSPRAAVIALVAILAACGESSPTPGGGTPTPAPSLTPVTNPISAQYCASVKPLSPLSAAPATCQAEWSSLGLTVVPPPDVAVFEGARAVTAVTNDAGPTVSDADARNWANAYIRQFSWYIWAEGYNQSDLLLRIAGPLDISPAETAAMQAHIPVQYSVGCVHPGAATIHPMGSDGQQFFASLQQDVHAPYVVVMTFPEGCVGATHSATPQSIVNLPPGSILINAGHFVDDPALGPIWFTDTAVPCTVAVAKPTGWCG